jgi:uncharacterized protein (DUF2235 family)
MGTEKEDADETHPTPRQIVLCCDGTNNTLTGGPRDTNVLKLISQLVPGDKGQVLYYDPGVGSPDQLPSLGLGNYLNRKRERIAGLAKGRGIYENIAEAYLFLVEKYEPGDQIYIFGFSRGAFTARCVAGMVNLFGLIRAESKPLILTLIRVYFSTPCSTNAATLPAFARYQAGQAKREKDFDDITKQKKQEAAQKRLKTQAENTGGLPVDAWVEEELQDSLLQKVVKFKRRMSTREEVAAQVKEEFTSPHGKNVAIHFVGVWDTVASVGLPFISKRTITSDGGTKEKSFRHIRHALSMDEHRATFEPRLYWDEDFEENAHWDQGKKVWVKIPPALEHTTYLPLKEGDGCIRKKDEMKYRSLKQRWFRGVHSDVGGGYDSEESGLGDTAYVWMLKEAILCGLRTDPKSKRPEWQPKPLLLHDQSAATPWWSLAGLIVRTNKMHQRASTDETVSFDKDKNAAVYRRKIHVINFFKGKLLWIVLSLFVASIALIISNRLSYFALTVPSTPSHSVSYLGSLLQGGLCLDQWQRNLWPLWCATEGLNHQIAIASGAYLYAAIWIDFLFIIAYGWLLGLLSGWAFREITVNRLPNDPVSPLFKLGWAPCFLVSADIAENLLSFLTLWFLDNNITGFTNYPSVVLPQRVYRLYAEFNYGLTDIAKFLHALVGIPIGPDHTIFHFSNITGFFLTMANVLKCVFILGCATLIGWGMLSRLDRRSSERKEKKSRMANGGSTKPALPQSCRDAGQLSEGA